MPASYTSGQSSYPRGHPICLSLSQRMHTASSTPCHGKGATVPVSSEIFDLYFKRAHSMWASVYSSTYQTSTAKWQFLKKGCFQSFNFFPGLYLLRELLKPLLGRTRSRGRCWAAIQLFHRPEPLSHVVHGEVDGLDIGGQHGRRFVLRHTHRPQRRPYAICTTRSGNVRHLCGGG